MKNQQINIETTYEEQRFLEFLKQKGNSRIVFSGIFGIGKTYFLNDFFKSREGFNVIRISPVNYSVHSNQDVFELIKFDVLTQLIRKIKQGQEFSLSSRFANFIGSNETTKFLVEQVKELDIPVLKINPIRTFLNFLEKANDKYNEINKTPNDTIKKFIQDITSNGLGVYDNGEIINVIVDLVAKLSISEDSQKVESVLLIDDLDRVDPEHVFRILNIFAAHHDFYGENGQIIDYHTLGFDKVIVVCDIENIRKMFHHKYGQGVDFFGYMDKFYSRQIYTYSNLENISPLIDKVLGTIRGQNEQGNFAFINDEFLGMILKDLILTGQLNLRRLFAVAYQGLTIVHRHSINGTIFRTNEYPIIHELKFLSLLLGGMDKLIEATSVLANHRIISVTETKEIDGLLKFIQAVKSSYLIKEKAHYLNCDDSKWRVSTEAGGIMGDIVVNVYQLLHELAKELKNNNFS